MLAIFFLSFFSEYKEKVKSGAIKDKNFFTEKPVLVFVDLLKTIDRGEIDEERFKAMKSIFFSSVEKDTGKEQEEIAYFLFQTAKQLSSEEILILSANYQVVKNTGKQVAGGVVLSGHAIKYWAQIISEKLDSKLLPDMVLQHEKHLVELNFISDKHYPTSTTQVVLGFEPTNYFRMTDLGYKLCEFINKYE